MATWGPNLPIYSQKQWDLINLAVLEVFKNAKFWKFVSKIQISKTKFTHFASFLKIFLGHNVLSTKRLALYGRVMKIDKKLRNERNLKIGRKSKIKNKPIFMTRTWYFQNGRSRKPLVRLSWNLHNHPQISPTFMCANIKEI